MHIKHYMSSKLKKTLRENILFTLNNEILKNLKGYKSGLKL